MLLKDKVVIITGVGPGMGRKMALLAAAEGAKVAVSARSEGFIKDVVGEIASGGGQAIAVPTDVADMAQCRRLADATVEAFGTITGLVNSAYRHGPMGGSFEAGDLEEWAANMNVTCFGALRMAKAVLPAMKQAGGGAIVNVGTMAAVKPMAGEEDYATAKAAMNGATRQLAREFGKYNIRVNMTRMGWLWGAAVKGYITWAAQNQGVSEQSLIDPIIKNIPLGVIPPDEECAKSVLFFVSDYSRMITGATLDVNGGEYMAP
jgi:NAD(P)-dependent dehydrogenase (short-subunit alcohol dehydrogenase family)